MKRDDCDARPGVRASASRAEAALARRRSRRSRTAARSICGVSQGLPGFSNPDDKGNWTGFDVDFCRAIAAAIFNDPTQGQVHAAVGQGPVRAAQDRRDRRAVAQHDLDPRRATRLFNFAGVNYYDGQGFMVRKALKVNSALELNGASVCTQTGTTTELNLADYFRANNMKYEVIAFATADETVKAYEAGPLRRVHDRRVAALCREAQAHQRQRPRHPARDHLQGAARPGRAPRRRPVVRHRQMGALRHAQCRGARRLVEERRRGAEVEPARDQAARRRRGQFRRAARPDQGLGRAHRQARRQLRRSRSSAMSAPARSSASAAASTGSGPRAASSMRRRSGERSGRRSAATAAGRRLSTIRKVAQRRSTRSCCWRRVALARLSNSRSTPRPISEAQGFASGFGFLEQHGRVSASTSR